MPESNDIHEHEADVFCQPCVDQGYHAGLEAAIEHVAAVLNRRETTFNDASSHIGETRDIVLDTFGEEFFEVDNQGLSK